MSLIDKLNKRKVCINPFGRKKCSTNRRQVTEWMIRKHSSLTENDYICDTCRNQLRALPNIDTNEPLNSTNEETIDYETYETNIEDDEDTSDEAFYSKDAAVESLNKFLNEVDISPIKNEQLCKKQYCNSKMCDIVDVLKSKIFCKCEPDKINNDGEIMLNS